MSDGFFYIYILANPLGVLYVGMTNDIRRRLAEHREQIHPNSYTARRRCNRLVYVERLHDPGVAILREKEIKSWRRKKKEALIKSRNPGWKDLARDWVLPSVGRYGEELPPKLPV